MNDNIFLKNKKDKCNPDVLSNLSKKNTERKKSEFQSSNTIYNPITNIVPNQIKNSKDLFLQKDSHLDNNALRKMLKTKEDERQRQDYELKPQKLKSLPNEQVIDKHIENFNELKKNSEIYVNKVQASQDQQKSNYRDIISNLKGLGIIK